MLKMHAQMKLGAHIGVQAKGYAGNSAAADRSGCKHVQVCLCSNNSRVHLPSQLFL